MAKKKPAVTRHFTRAQLEKMSADDLAELIASAPPGAVFNGKAVVRDRHGNIKYDDPKTKGSFGETEAELAS